MNKNIDNTHPHKWLNVLELMSSIDKIDIDDENFLMGMFRRSKSFLNIKSFRTILSPIEYY